MHPVIRISIFLIFTYFIVQAKPGQLLLAGFILFSISLFQSTKTLKIMWRMIWRLKWFYISIIVLFSFFAPTDIDSALYAASIRIIALMMIVIAVIVLIVAIPTDKLIASLVLLSKPLSVFGFSSERFAVRVYLIIEFVEELPAIISKSNNSEQIRKHSKSKKIVSSLTLIANEVYLLAENTKCKKIHYDKIDFPKFYQWAYLLISIGLFYFSDIVYTKLVI